MGPWAQCLDPTFRVNVADPPRLPTKNDFPELIRGFRGFRGFPGNGPNHAGLVLGSTRAGGKDDGSSHRLPQKTTYRPLVRLIGTSYISNYVSTC